LTDRDAVLQAIADTLQVPAAAVAAGTGAANHWLALMPNPPACTDYQPQTEG